MKRVRNVIAVVLLLSVAAAVGYRYFGGSERPDHAKSLASIYHLAYTAMDGREVRLAEYRGRAMLIVNVATECGFTPQYEGLQKLYEERKDRLVVIGFPANDFLGQEPGTDEQIRAFCEDTYGVTFPMSRKVSVVGESKHPVFRWLTDPSLNGWNAAGPKWNFYKYLVGADGELLAVFPSTTTPESDEILAYLR